MGAPSEMFNQLKRELGQTLDGQTPASGRDFKGIIKEMLSGDFNIGSFPKTMLTWAKSAGYSYFGKSE